MVIQKLGLLHFIGHIFKMHDVWQASQPFHCEHICWLLLSILLHRNVNFLTELAFSLTVIKKMIKIEKCGNDLNYTRLMASFFRDNLG